MKKWLAIPVLAGAILVGGVAMVANADKNEFGTPLPSEATVGGIESQVKGISYEQSDGFYEDDFIKDSGQYISAEEAIAIAMKSAQGTVTELELDEDDGRVYYEIEIEDGVFEYEFEIDAMTGEVIEWEKERDDD